MMRNLGVVDDNDVWFTMARQGQVPLAKFVRFRPVERRFSAVVSNPKAAMEAALRRFCVVTVGDTIEVPIAGEEFELQVMEVKPDGASHVSVLAMTSCPHCRAVGGEACSACPCTVLEL
jgi:hypothetical protein